MHYFFNILEIGLIKSTILNRECDAGCIVEERMIMRFFLQHSFSKPLHIFVNVDLVNKRKYYFYVYTRLVLLFKVINSYQHCIQVYLIISFPKTQKVMSNW